MPHDSRTSDRCRSRRDGDEVNLADIRRRAEEALARAAKATLGPWASGFSHWGESRVDAIRSDVDYDEAVRRKMSLGPHGAEVPVIDYNAMSLEDARFIAAARVDVPELARDVLILVERVEQLEANRAEHCAAVDAMFERAVKAEQWAAAADDIAAHAEANRRLANSARLDAEAERDKMRAGMLNYGWHKDHCLALVDRGLDRAMACNCGFAAALEVTK